MRRLLVAGSVIVMLLVVIALTSDFRPMTSARPQPSEFGVQTPDDGPFEIGTVLDSQSFR